MITLFTGAIIAQAILFFAKPLLTRLYIQENLFADFFNYSATVAVIASFSNYKMKSFIVLPKNDINALNLLFLGTSANIIVNFSIFFVVTILNIVEINIPSWIYFAPFSAFAIAQFDLLEEWQNRYKNYKAISSAKIAKSIGILLFQVSFAFLFIEYGLIFGIIIGQIIALFVISIKSSKKQYFSRKNISKKKLRILFRQHFKPANYLSFISLLNSSSQKIPFLLISELYTPKSAAFYGLAERMIAPSDIIGNSIGSVFYRKANEIYLEKKSLVSFLKKSYANLFKINILLLAGLFLISYGFDWIFGNEKWLIAGKMLRILLIWYLAKFLVMPISPIVNVLQKQKQLFLYDIVLFIVRALSFVLGFIIFHDLFWSITGFSIAGLFMNILLLFYFLKIAKNADETR